MALKVEYLDNDHHYLGGDGEVFVFFFGLLTGSAAWIAGRHSEMLPAGYPALWVHDSHL